MTGDSPVVLAKPVDAAALAELHALAFDKPWDAEAFLSLLSQTNVFSLMIPDRAFILTRCAGDEAEILTVATDPAHRNQGYASTLLRDAKRRLAAQGVVSVFLEVAAGNQAAQALYQKAQFCEVSRRAAYYKRADGIREDALVFQCNLPPSMEGTSC